MAFYRDPPGLCRLKHPLALCWSKADILAKHIHGFEKPFLPQLRQGVLTNMVYISIGILAVLFRHRVSGQQRRADLNGMGMRQTLDHAQHLLFRFVVQAITGFDFEGGDAFAHQAL